MGHSPLKKGMTQIKRENSAPKPSRTTTAKAAQESANAHLSIEEKFDRYATLRDTRMGIEAEMDSLNADIKAHLAAGGAVSNELYEGMLRQTTRTEYPVDTFRAAFGDETTLALSSVNNKLVKSAIENGTITAEAAAEVAVHVPGAVSLMLRERKQTTPEA